nr:hypothetical protein [Haladaptatus sp. W1]
MTPRRRVVFLREQRIASEYVADEGPVYFARESAAARQRVARFDGASNGVR